MEFRIYFGKRSKKMAFQQKKHRSFVKCSKQTLQFAKIFELLFSNFDPKFKTILASCTKIQDNFAYLSKKSAQILHLAKTFDRVFAHLLNTT